MTKNGVSGTDEQWLLDSARRGDEDAYRELVEVHRAELHAHCYRMLASVPDAEDAVQDALVRAWRGLARFEGRSSVRTWLFKIATNTALDIARRRSRRELPLEHGPAAGPGESPGPPILETLWVEPYPDQMLGLSDRFASPESRYELRESIELAFVAALQHLPAQQRAVLILREVLAFTASEVAELLDTTVPAVNSALQRARVGAATRLPERSQQVTVRSLGEGRIRDLAARYSQAIERGDLKALLSLLTEDATWAMPPLATWYRGREAIATFHSRYVFTERWRHLTTRASGQLAVGCYTFDSDRHCYVASVLDVLTLEGDRIAQVTGFIATELLAHSDREQYRFVGAEAFPRFGLPDELPA
jgi:RNA polymerase sigma-70 factor, ECF subfamily